MKHRVLVALTLAALATAAVAATALGAGKGPAYEFRGELLAASGSSVQVRVEGGTHNALKALIGQSQDQTFAIGPATRILPWAHGRPRTGTATDLKQGDLVTVRVRAPRRSSLSDLERTAAATVADHSPHGRRARGPLYLYVGTVAGPQPGDRVALHVTSGNWRGLHTMLGQSLDQTFAVDDGTIFLLWQGRRPTVIDPAQLKAGDRITVRVHAARGATLAQVEATAANHVGDHEPGDPATEN